MIFFFWQKDIKFLVVGYFEDHLLDHPSKGEWHVKFEVGM